MKRNKITDTVAIKQNFRKTILGLVASTICVATLNADETKVEQMVIPVSHCSQTIKNIVINEVECKASSCDGSGAKSGMFGLAQMLAGGGVEGIGKGVKSMLTNAIKETKCFKIVDLEQFEKVKKMMEATGQKVNPPKIDLFISGTISSVEVNKEGGALGGGFIPLLGLISKNTEKANMVLDVTTMDPNTMEIGEAKSFKADSEKSSWGFGAVGPGFGGGWSVSKSLALDNVVRDVVFSTTNYLAETYAKDVIIDRPVAKKED